VKAALKKLLDDQSNLPLARYSGRGGVRARRGRGEEEKRG
jgi:hypothetical protein